MRPLEGVRVVDLSTGIAGPLAGMLLADYGAEVVKIEPPTGDSGRALPGFAVWNRNKESVVLDAATDAGRQRLAALLAGADVCIYGDASAVQPLLDAAATANLGLTLLHMPPYLPHGAPWAGGDESHELLTAITGLSSRQSSFDGGPVHLVFPIALYEQGVWAAACAVSALVERQQSGRGQQVTVAGVHGVLTCSPGSFVVDPAQPPLPTNVGPGGRNPTYTTYRCSDGAWLFLAALTPKFQANAFRVLGVGDVFADPRIDGVPNRLVLTENRGWVRELLAERFTTRTRDEWLALLEAGDCPAGPLFDRDDWLDHPQLAANGLRVEVDDPERGPVVMPGLCIDLAATPGAIRSPAPRLGEHTETAGRWQPREPHASVARPVARATDVVPACSPSGAPADTARGGPLAGVRVLDLGTILAGPYAGALLAGLGADVVKVEAPSGDAFRETGFFYNRGMRGLSIDLRSAAGQQAFHRLAQTADVVLDNARLGVSKRLGVDYATLARVHPGIITLSIAGFGDHGALAHKPAFDPILQAMSGMMTAQGGDSDPAFATIAINDVAAAVIAVLGIALALYHRGQTGQGQRAMTSLVAASALMQSGELVRFAGRPPAVRGGRDFVGPSPADRFYRAADGWLRVQAASLCALAAALGIAPSGQPAQADSDTDTHGAIAEVFAGLPVASALARLHDAGVPAVPAHQPIAVVNDPSLQQAALFTTRTFPDGTPYVVPHAFAQFSRSGCTEVADAPGLGEHSRTLLADAGLTDPDIDALVADGVVVEGGPFVLAEFVNYR
jgi:crotonobetainyl-CoA:carnitine CoA-transferase CaiB-like acyl-CoA transferase